MRPAAGYESADWHGRWEERWTAGRQPDWPGARRARLLIPVVVCLIIQVPAAVFRVRLGQGSAADDRAIIIGIVLAFFGPLLLLGARRFPGPVVALVCAAASVDLLVTAQVGGPPYVALAFAIVGAIARGARAWAWISVAAAWVLTLGLASLFGLSWQPLRIAATTLGILVVFGVGESIRTRRERFEQIGRSVAERKQSEVQAERVRIARELHDVLAHSLSQMNVQASVALHLMNKHPEGSADALASIDALSSIKETSKTALDEVRSVLGVLRAEGGADPSAPLVPEPDLSRLPGLAASVTSQGVAVDLDNSLPSVPPASIQLAVYRIVQEALTNVIRHSGATNATVQLSEADGVYRISISDDGHGSPTPRPDDDAGGRGLLGMRERAELLGGSLTTTSTPAGFSVVATIPQPRKDDR